MATALTAALPAVAPAPPRGAGLFGPVAADVEEADRILAATLAGYRSPVAPLVHHLAHYRGKRLRPALLLLTGKACGGVTPAHHTLAAAVEMIHTATLVHDDVLDEAEVRRHVATVNAGWGNKVSILLGDLLFTHAFHLTSTVDSRACRVIGEATNRVCAGELRQVCERGNLDLTEADYFAVIDGKTAALTEAACRLGALYAGAPEETADRLALYGRNLGRAFQIADDLLDLVGDEATAGKTLGTDLDQRKLTLPVIHCLGRLPAAEAETLREAIRAGGPGVGAKVLAAVGKTGSVAHARFRADDLARAARRELECLPRSECRSLLEGLTEWSVRREK
jgi:octaprenyl-diphosphate synthase